MSGQKRITKELGELLSSPPTGIEVSLPSESDIHKWDVMMQGPQGSVFAAGKFRLKLILPPQYPFSPPAVIVTTPVHHPNISPAGFIFPSTTTTAATTTTTSTSTPRARATAPSSHSAASKAGTAAATSAADQMPQSNICLPMLRVNAWKPSTRISEILVTAQQLLAEPSAEDVLEGDVGRQWRDERKAWEAKAKSWVEQYAKT